MKEPLKVFIRREAMFGDMFHVRMGRRVNGGIAIAQEIAFVVLKEDEISAEPRPALTLSRDDAQAFMDELWSAGIRPTEGTGSAGQLAATQAHLKDMQKLVFEVLKP